MALYCSRNYHSGSFEYFRKCLHVRQHTISQVCRYDVDMKMREFEDGCGVSWLNLLAQVFLFMLVFLMTSYTACQCFKERVNSDFSLNL